MTPNVETTPWDEDVALRKDQVVYDLVYNPPQTRLLRRAAGDGAQTIGGLGMLIWQGAIAFERWTGQQPPVDTMRRAALDDLRARGVLPRPAPDATVQVRLATLADAELISTLNADVQQLHADALPHIFKPPTDESWPPAAVGELIKNSDHYFWVAICDGVPAGYLYAQQRTSPVSPSKYEQDFLYIHHLSVKPSFQQRGCGERLVAAAKAFAQEQQLPELILDTWAFNEKAQRFFAQQGFEIFNYRMRLSTTS
ncbi:MAG: hypothetical protein DCC55_13200 [Chloroflexi bacterium]|nr:MAG: hypothetical protein DCC55_13200 [Chloroflexota bacterium]